jgi:hypothetical protein
MHNFVRQRRKRKRRKGEEDEIGRERRVGNARLKGE